ncbi:MAG: TIM barrel protein [Chthoniobacterales bacterium]
MNEAQLTKAISALDSFRIETPSWGFANTGTRFGKFLQDAAAIDIGDKLADAGQVHRFTGCCPTVAVHVLWDFKASQAPAEVAKLAGKYGVGLGAVNPNVFQDQQYKYGSVCNRDAAPRGDALKHLLDSVELAKQLGSKLISLWLADGSNYPGQANIRWRKQAMIAALHEVHERLDEDQMILVEYKPFEPTFYHTDLADWGMAYLAAKAAGPRAKVLVDTGHHYQAQNIEQIVAWLLEDEMLGGFHFNDRRYADDDLTLGSIDPYQVFRIFHEIHFYAWDKGRMPAIPYMIDQSHIDKPKIEAMIQSAVTAQELYAKAALADHARLARHQERNEQVDAEECLKDAFATDVRPALVEWRKRRNLPAEPLQAFRESGYEKRVAKERKERRIALGLSGTSSYA